MTSENEKLKVGDEVFYAKRNRKDKDVTYIFKSVVRLTATQAVLTDGEKLKNEPSKDWQGNIRFIELGNRDSWHLATEKVKKDAEAEKHRQTVNRWFRNHDFTDEQKKQIYNLFNPNNDTKI